MDKDRYIAQGIATAPITTSALRQLLKRSHVDTDEVVTDYAPVTVKGLCTHTNINKWAKFKPVNSERLFSAEKNLEEIMQEANYGLIASNLLYDAESLALSTSADSSDYLYDQVRAPYHFWHFTKYNHMAVCPIRVEWQKKDTDYGQSISAILNLDERDISGQDLISNYINSLGKNLDDYTFAIAVIQNENVVAYVRAEEPLKEYYDEYSREIGCYLNEVAGMTDNAATYAVAMLLGNNDAISLNADRGAMSETFIYDRDAVSIALKGITCKLDSFTFERQDYDEENFAWWHIDDITFLTTIPNIVEFMARYTTGKNASSLQSARWKMQIRSVDGGDLYVPTDSGGRPVTPATGWVDLFYTGTGNENGVFIPNSADDPLYGLWEEGETKYTMFADAAVNIDGSLGDCYFFGVALKHSTFFTDRDTSTNNTMTFGLRMVLYAGGDSNTYREIAYESAEIEIPLNGNLANNIIT